MRKYFYSLVMLLFSVGICFAQEDIPSPTPGTTGQQQFQGFALKGYDNQGKESWDLKGDTADIQGTQVILSNVNAKSYGEQPVNVTANSGTIDQTTGTVLLQKDVIISSDKGSQQLMTDELNWDRNKDLVSTDKDVLITDDRMTVTGTGMTATPGLKTASIKEDVTVRLNTEEDHALAEKILTVTSDGPMEIDQAKGVAVFQDNVFAIQENQTLKADRMEIYFDMKLNKVKEMVCIGNVEIKQGENKTYAERAVYNALTQKISLYGRPKLILITEGEGAITAPRDKKSH